MRRAWLGWVLVVGCATADGGSDDTDTDTDTDTDVVAQGADPDAVRACLAEAWVRSTCTGCHFGGNHLDLTDDALAELKSKNRESDPSTPLLVPGDADASLLVRKLEARAGLITLEEGEGDPMPPDTTIDADDAKLIRDWVESGAPLPEGC